MTQIVVAIVIFGIAGAALILTFRKRKPKLSAATQRVLQQQWSHATSLSDAHGRILEADKVLDQLLGAMGYQGPLGEKLKAAGPRLPNANAVWTAHKLRNRLAHEPGFQPSDGELNQAMRAFEVTLRAFVPLSSGR